MTCNGFGEIISDGSLIGGILLGTAILVLAVPPLLRFFYKGVVREIVVVKKRETVRDFFSPGFVSSNHSGPPRKSSYEETRHTSVDYRIKGKKLLHTKFCDKDIIKKLTVGQTYTVRIRLNYIVKIFPKK